MQQSKARKVLQGDPRKYGAQRIGSGYNFTSFFGRKEAVSLLLYEKGSKMPVEEIDLKPEYYVGEAAAVYLPDFSPRRYEYNYRVGEKVLQDPMAQRIIRTEEFGSFLDEEKAHEVRCGFGEEKYEWEDDCRPLRPFSETILYKVHVRGYTKQKNSKVRSKGTFRGLAEKIPYLKELGITALELMPVYDFDEVLLPKNLPLSQASQMKEKMKVNFWGYTGGNYYAPKPAYAASKNPVTEMKDLVKALHREGIECILEFYFPGEVGAMKVLSILQHWYMTYHVDGFHLIGEGVPAELLMDDPILADAKLFFLGGFEREDKETMKERRVAEYNEGFKQEMRRFLKGDEDSLNQALYRIRNNPESHGVVNYMTNQDGFTMMDLVSYDTKHNEANGEGNRDGTSYNFSWNCGVEGPSRKAAVSRLRKKQMKNAFLFLLLSQGIPMIYGGDEFANSQQGNNNAYCQDNEIGWVDWNAFGRNRELTDFVREAIAFRKNHGVFHQDSQLRNMDYKSVGYPDLSYHSSRAWYASYDNVSYHVGLMYCGAYAKKGDESLDDMMYVAYNFHWEPHEFALPKLPEGQSWNCIFRSGEKLGDTFFKEKGFCLENQKMAVVEPRSISIFMGQQESEKSCSHGSILRQSQDTK